MKFYLKLYPALLLTLLPSIAFSIEISTERHTTPVPNLLKLYIEQTSTANAELISQQQALDELQTLIITEEQHLLDAALDNDEMESLDQMGLLIMQSRLELITQGVRANALLKDTLSESDFQKLLQSSDDTPNKALLNDEALLLKHANPMPNLVAFVLANDTMPALVKQQRERLEKWQFERSSVFAKQSHAIVEMESQLAEMVENEAPIETLNTLADNIAQLRVRIIRGKVFSRERVKQILQNEQYQNLLGSYPTSTD